jgi:hypothetical protein
MARRRRRQTLASNYASESSFSVVGRIFPRSDYGKAAMPSRVSALPEYLDFQSENRIRTTI